jgi:hypothetical protein
VTVFVSVFVFLSVLAIILKTAQQIPVMDGKQVGATKWKTVPNNLSLSLARARALSLSRARSHWLQIFETVLEG